MTTQEQAFVLSYLFYCIPKYYAVPKYPPARASNPSALLFKGRYCIASAWIKINDFPFFFQEVRGKCLWHHGSPVVHTPLNHPFAAWECWLSSKQLASCTTSCPSWMQTCIISQTGRTVLGMLCRGTGGKTCQGRRRATFDFAPHVPETLKLELQMPGIFWWRTSEAVLVRSPGSGTNLVCQRKQPWSSSVTYSYFHSSNVSRASNNGRQYIYTFTAFIAQESSTDIDLLDSDDTIVDPRFSAPLQVVSSEEDESGDDGPSTTSSKLAGVSWKWHQG